jgi:hypothetical protein
MNNIEIIQNENRAIRSSVEEKKFYYPDDLLNENNIKFIDNEVISNNQLIFHV